MLEGYVELLPFLTQFFKLMDDEKLLGVTSQLSLAETLVKPMADKNLELQDIYQKVIQTSGGLEVIPISREILRF